MEYLELIITGVSAVVAIITGIVAKIKSRIITAKEEVKKAVEKAEGLKNATGEQKKAYAFALIRQVIRYFSDKKISKWIEEEVRFTKNVNVKKSDKEIY